MIMQTEKNNCISERIFELNMQKDYHFFVKDGKLGRFFLFFWFTNLPWEFPDQPWDRGISLKTVGPTAKPWYLAGLQQPTTKEEAIEWRRCQKRAASEHNNKHQFRLFWRRVSNKFVSFNILMFCGKIFFDFEDFQPFFSFNCRF